MKVILAILALLLATPAFAQVTNIPCNQLPALTGDTTTAAASCATTTTKINGVDQTTAWTAFTPSLSCGTATFTVTSARSKTMGKTTWIQIEFVITVIGTCAVTNVLFNLPNTTQSSGGMIGREANTNAGLDCYFFASATQAQCLRTAATTWLVNDRAILSGVYENQ